MPRYGIISLSGGNRRAAESTTRNLYNGMGEDEWIMQSGSPRIRGDGTPWVHIHLTLPDDMIGTPFWPWREEAIPNMLHSCPGGDYYLEVWDVFKNGKFLRTEYNLR